MLSDPKDAAFIFEMHRSLGEIAELIQDEVGEAFVVDRWKPHALAVLFLTLGEAANRVSRKTWALYPKIEWQQIATIDAPALANALPVPPPPSEIF